jgi:hypothetical protein
MRHLFGLSDNDSITDASPSQRIERLTSVVGTTAHQWVIAVGEVRRNDGNAAYVTVILMQPDGTCKSRRIRVRGAGELARSRLSTQLLDELRRRLR